MKSRKQYCFTAIMLLAALAIPVSVAADDERGHYQILRKGALHPVAKVTPINEHFQHFLEEMNLGRSVWADAASVAALFPAAVGTGTRPVHGLGLARASGRKTSPVSQRLLRAGFCDLLWNDSQTRGGHREGRLARRRCRN
jgi:hypothetical protein